MYKTRSVVNNLIPFIPNVAGRERFATWLFRSNRNFSKSYSRLQTPAQVSAEPFLNGSSSNYVEEMYNAWLEDPKSVHKVSELQRNRRSCGRFESRAKDIFYFVAFILRSLGTHFFVAAQRGAVQGQRTNPRQRWRTRVAIRFQFPASFRISAVESLTSVP